MMISDGAHAAQAVTRGEEPRFYDDRGCLAQDAARLPDTARLFVQLDGGKGWIDVRDAFFALPRDARTPMGHGVSAFRNEGNARRADRGGRALRWEAVVRELSRGPAS
jgi:copper chaperone NosL